MPKDLIVNVNITDTERFKELLSTLKGLVHQVEINDYTDSFGHELKINKAYVDFKELLGGIK